MNDLDKLRHDIEGMEGVLGQGPMPMLDEVALERVKYVVRQECVRRVADPRVSADAIDRVKRTVRHELVRWGTQRPPSHRGWSRWPALLATAAGLVVAFNLLVIQPRDTDPTGDGLTGFNESAGGAFAEIDRLLDALAVDVAGLAEAWGSEYRMSWETDGLGQLDELIDTLSNLSLEPKES